jgi:hypothetical protein
MLISQLRGPDGRITVVAREGSEAYEVKGADGVRGLALEAIAAGKSLVDTIRGHGFGAPVDLAGAYAEGRLMLPVSHDDPAHLHITGTGLTHLGSAATRDAMHTKVTGAAEAELTDSMKMFRMGLEGGKPAAGRIGVLAHRKHFVTVEHAELVPVPIENARVILSETPANVATAGTTFGQHFLEVLSEILGLSEDEIIELVAVGALE